MSSESPQSPLPGPMGGVFTPSAGDLRELKDNWLWFLILGIGMIVLGFFALSVPFIPGLFAVIVFGILIFLGGIVQIISCFWTRKWSTFFLDLLLGILYLVVGGLILRNPVMGLKVVTLLLAAAYLVGGVFRVVGAFTLRFQNWVWMLLSGAISVILGLIIFSTWPLSSLVVIGILIGVDLIFAGWTWVMMGMVARQLAFGEGGAEKPTESSPASEKPGENPSAPEGSEEKPPETT